MLNTNMKFTNQAQINRCVTFELCLTGSKTPPKILKSNQMSNLGLCCIYTVMQHWEVIAKRFEEIKDNYADYTQTCRTAENFGYMKALLELIFPNEDFPIPKQCTEERISDERRLMDCILSSVIQGEVISDLISNELKEDQGSRKLLQKHGLSIVISKGKTFLAIDESVLERSVLNDIEQYKANGTKALLSRIPGSSRSKQSFNSHKASCTIVPIDYLDLDFNA